MTDAAPIATHFDIDASKPAASIAGRRCYAALDRRDATRRLLAVQVEAFRPPRAGIVGRALAPVPNIILPIDHGAGRDPAGTQGWFIICAAPPGPPLSAQPGAWSESEIISGLLLPAAAALEALAEQGLTHRAIRPDNIFRAGRGERATLGPCWAGPPAADQPIAYEPPYSAMCHPCGRGDGSIADDVYALGVTMLWCAMGGQVTWPDTPSLIHRKLELGSLDALGATRALNPSLLDLLRVMLAEDPEHRPSPSLLQDPTQARARRVATRPQQRAMRPLDVGGMMASSARELAFAISRAPEAGETLIRNGTADRWLRRMLGDTHSAVALDEAVFRRGNDPEAEDSRSHPMFVMRAVAALDPLAPLQWRNQAFFPDGLPAAAAAALAPGQSNFAGGIEEIVTYDVLTHWAATGARRRGDISGIVQESRDWRFLVTTRGPMGGIRRLAYTLNPLLACASPLFAPGAVVRLPALLGALEASAAADTSRPPVDAHVISFIASHADVALLTQISAMDGFSSPRERIAALSVYARLQHLLHRGPMPAFAAWLLDAGLNDLTEWRNLRTRAAIADGLKAAAAAGDLNAMLGLVRNETAREADAQGGEQARARLAAIDAELRALADTGPARAEAARRGGYDIAAAIGFIGLIVAATVLAIPG